MIEKCLLHYNTHTSKNYNSYITYSKVRLVEWCHGIFNIVKYNEINLYNMLFNTYYSLTKIVLKLNLFYLAIVLR